MIKDGAGDEMLYWPISGLIEGQDSQVLTIKVDAGVGRLVSTMETRAKVWGRRKAIGGVYYDLAVSPIDLSALSGEIEFEIYVEALSPIEGFERVPLAVAVATQSSAGWTV